MLNRDKWFRLLGLIVLILSFVIAWFWMGLRSFENSSVNPSKDVAVFDIEPGMNLRSIAATLHSYGLLERPQYFVWLARLGGQARRIQAGEYEIPPGMTVKTLLGDFTSGKVRQHGFTIVEGWTFRQMMAAVSASKELRHTLNGFSDEQIMQRLGVPGEHPEGRFLPDTYFFPKGTMDVEFLKRAYHAMRQYLDHAWQQRRLDLPYETPYEALIMASIVEKETAVADERVAIAGVFVRRLEKGMRLQTDPTVIYGLGGDYNGNLRRRDLKRDTPYNTYTRKGLTPTPIAMPSAGAIDAAFDPASGDALYFVAKGDGSHHFSATVEEHNRAVKRFQIRNRSRDYRSSPPPPGDDGATAAATAVP